MGCSLCVCSKKQFHTIILSIALGGRLEIARKHLQKQLSYTQPAPLHSLNRLFLIAPRGQDYIAQVVRPVYNNNSPERAKEETIIERTQFRPYRTISV